ncbi:glycosyltransferase family 2 protein [Telluribacter sp.]|jgi:cellulose synthase/poly-beta-1,6-N-acetylglucosamine synthase-like glycosyltransferase|uniref:glycosyltransferase n=1 Tax=Telluribacter sp. TaxID=1978767 RepID=UPI002E129FA7|nr:glycosyltransferase family 2 protein [Telluribacter sp.]
MELLTLLAYLLFSATAFVTLYLFVFAVAGMFRKPATYHPEARPRQRRMAVFLPSYKEDAVIVDSAVRALEQKYPKDRFEVVVIADSLQPDTLVKLRALPIRVVEVVFETSTKAKALNAALQQLDGQFEVAVVLDADNVMAPDFLDRVSQAMERGWKVVQGHRTAKNTNTGTAILDAVSEEINNHIFRKGHRVLGLSSALIGSGMAFDYTLFIELMTEIQAIGGFDKELEMRLLKQRIRIEYLDDALCYDEKVQNAAVFEKQRTRWIAAQIKYLRLNFWPGIAHLLRGNIDYFDKVVQTMLPPRVMLLGGLVGATVPVWLIWGLSTLSWFVTIQLAMLVATFYISTPPALRQKLGWREFSQVPALFIRFFKSILKMGEAQKKFIHTPHGTE